MTANAVARASAVRFMQPPVTTTLNASREHAENLSIVRVVLFVSLGP